MKKIPTLIIVYLCVFAPTINTASAMLIQGQIDFCGISTTTDNGSVVTSVDFGSFEVSAVTGDFVTYVTPGDTVAFLDFPTVEPLDLWSVGGFSFNLNLITINALLGSTAIIEGSGLISKTNYDITPFVWTYSSKRGSNTSFSSTLNPAVTSDPIFAQSSETFVSAPTSVVILGFSILGFGILHYKNKTNLITE